MYSGENLFFLSFPSSMESLKTFSDHTIPKPLSQNQSLTNLLFLIILSCFHPFSVALKEFSWIPSGLPVSGYLPQPNSAASSALQQESVHVVCTDKRGMLSLILLKPTLASYPWFIPWKLISFCSFQWKYFT